MGGTPLKEKKQFSQNFSLFLLKAMKPLNRHTTLDFLPHNRCGTKHENKKLNKIKKHTRLKKIQTRFEFS